MYIGGLYCLFIDKYKVFDMFLFFVNEKYFVNEVSVGCNVLQNVLLKLMSWCYIICNKKIDIIFLRYFYSNFYCKFVVLKQYQKIFILFIFISN